MFKTLAITMLLLGLVAQGATAHDNTLSGTRWVMGDGSGRSIAFSAGGRVSGFAGCNRFIGSYTQSGDNLRIKALGNTRMGCFKGKGADDAAFLGMLTSVRKFAITAKGLNLQSAARKAVVILRRN